MDLFADRSGARNAFFRVSSGSIIYCRIRLPAAETEQRAPVVLMAPCDMGYKFGAKPDEFRSLMDSKKNGCFRLSHETVPEEEAEANYTRRRFSALPGQLPAAMPSASPAPNWCMRSSAGWTGETERDAVLCLHNILP